MRPPICNTYLSVLLVSVIQVVITRTESQLLPAGPAPLPCSPETLWYDRDRDPGVGGEIGGAWHGVVKITSSPCNNNKRPQAQVLSTQSLRMGADSIRFVREPGGDWREVLTDDSPSEISNTDVKRQWPVSLPVSASILSQIGLPPSPCPDTFWYEQDPNGGWHGVLKVVTPPWFQSLTITLSLALRRPLSTVPGVSPGNLTLRGGEKAARAAVNEASRGRSYALYFDAYVTGARQPTILNATVDGRVICLDLNEEQPANTVWLQYSLRSTPSQLGTIPPGQVISIEVPPSEPQPQSLPTYPSRPYEPQPLPSQQPTYPEPAQRPPSQPRPPNPPPRPRPQPPQQPVYPEPVAQAPATVTAPSQRPTQRPHQPHQPQSSVQFPVDPAIAECGRDVQMPNQLVLNGPKAKPYSWPWHVAIYRKIGGATFSFNYQCGGTLVSTSFVLTAAHCVDKVSSTDLIVFLGKYDITSLTEKDQQTVQTDYVRTHPEYHSYLNDVALMRLATPAMITASVGTACLWSGSVELSAVVNQVGWVPGWGKDDSGNISAELRVAGMPIVSQETCLRSDNFYANYTSDRTFCAGFRNGTGVCNGDSGGGLFLRSRDGKWLLRGIVSLAMTLPALQSCDTGSYVVFTDVAKFLPWIKGTMSALQPR